MHLQSPKLLFQPTVRKYLGLLFFGFCTGILLYGFANFNRTGNPVEFYLSGALGAVVLTILFILNEYLNRWISWKRQPGLRLLLGILLNLLLSCAISFWAIRGYQWIIDETLDLLVHTDELLKIGILLFTLSILYSVVYFALYSYTQYTTVQLEELRQKRKQAELQLSILKSQLSPHFLFNSINVLSVLFRKDIEKAEGFIRALAQCYQYTLDTHRMNLVSVAEELQFVEAYCYLLAARFGAGFQLGVEIPDSIRTTKVPPLTLQLLVENAAKHNVFSKQQPLKVTLANTAEKIVVTNNITEKRLNVHSTKLGLSNIKNRYRLLSHKELEINETTEFEVRLPILK